MFVDGGIVVVVGMPLLSYAALAAVCVCVCVCVWELVAYAPSLVRVLVKRLVFPLTMVTFSVQHKQRLMCSIFIQCGQVTGRTCQKHVLRHFC